MNSFVLVADSNGDVEIFQVAYETKWKDLCIMLQVKFDYDTLPIFTYTDDEDDIICLDSQEDLDEALKVCKKNDDVLHVQIRRYGSPPPRRVQRSLSSQKDTRKQVTNHHIEMARAAMGNTIGWATNAVKSVFSKNVSSDPVSEDTCKKDPQPSNEILMQAVKSPEETELEETVLHEVDRSFQTSVKEVVESELDDISVPTTTMQDTDDESEVIVKEPIPSTSEQTRHDERHIDPAMLQSIKEEVRMAISQELQTLRSEVTGLTQSITSKQFEDGDKPCTSRDLEERPRSPTEIKADIRKLKLEMKEAKQIRKIQKHNEKALKKRSFENELVSPVLSPEVETKRVRKYAASFICENLLDGSFVGVRQQFVKYWVLKNEGTITWDEQIQLKLVQEKLTEDSSSVDSKSDDENRIDPMQLETQYGPEKVSLGVPIVESGNTAVIAVTHVAPAIPCVYTSAWRLCHSNKFFGPRIWCNVTVKNHIDTRSHTSDELLSLVAQVSDRSYASKNWEPARKISTEEAMGADDDLSNMLSFEMTAVGDFNNETSSIEHHSSNFGNFRVAYPPQRSQSTDETPVEITEAEVVAEQNVEEVVNKSESPAQEPTAQDDVVERPEILEELEKSMEVPEESVMVFDEREASLNFHSIPQPEEIPEAEVIEEKEQEDASMIQDPEVLDTEEQEDFHDLDDTHSDVPSDFEVIPLPECFDTTKPLNSLEKEEAESVKSHLSNLAIYSQDEEMEDESLPPPPPVMLAAMDTKEETVEEPAVNEEEEENKEQEENEREESESEEEVEEEVPLPLSKPTTSSAPPDKSIAPAPLPVPQSVLDMNKPASSSMVQDYSTGYQTPVQKTAPAEEAWISQPIPLPRGVLDADKPWSKNVEETVPKTAPLPHPRSSTQHQGCEKDVVCEMQTAHTDSPPVAVAEDTYPSPAIHLPPNHEFEEVDEFTLAPETPVDRPLPILVPPGYPVPPSTLPSAPFGSPVYYPIPPPAMPENHSGLPVFYPIPPPTLPDTPAVAAPVSPPPPPPHNPSPLEQLVDMGFLDIDFNNELLEEFEGDVNKAVHALVYRGAENRTHRRGHARRGNGTFLA